jgi:hypothetical protein
MCQRIIAAGCSGAISLDCFAGLKKPNCGRHTFGGHHQVARRKRDAQRLARARGPQKRRLHVKRQVTIPRAKARTTHEAILRSLRR